MNTMTQISQSTVGHTKNTLWQSIYIWDASHVDPQGFIKQLSLMIKESCPY